MYLKAALELERYVSWLRPVHSTIENETWICSEKKPQIFFFYYLLQMVMFFSQGIKNVKKSSHNMAIFVPRQRDMFWWYFLFFSFFCYTCTFSRFYASLNIMTTTICQNIIVIKVLIQASWSSELWIPPFLRKTKISS